MLVPAALARGKVCCGKIRAAYFATTHFPFLCATEPREYPMREGEAYLITNFTT